MIVLWSALALAVALMVEIALGRVAPGVLRYVDLMSLPMAWYALTRSQRSAMFVGCAGGLLEDAWFQGGLYGVGGFVRTLMGWILGGLGARFDLNVLWARALSGALVPVVGPLLELGVRRLFDQRVLAPSPWELGIRAAAGGLLLTAVFAIVERVAGSTRKTGQARPRR